MRGGCLALRLVLLFAAASIALIVFGVAEIRDGMRFPSPVQVTYRDFIRQQPKEGWYLIKGAALDLKHAAYRESENSKSIERAYVPLHNAVDHKESAIHVLVETTDRGIMQTVSNAREAKSSGSDGGWLPRDVQGMIKAGLNSEGSKTRRDIESLSLGSSLAPDSIFFEEGKSPSLLRGFGLTLGGLALGVGLVFYLILRRSAR